MSVHSLRADYLAGRFDADEYERALDEMLAEDPEALDRPEPRTPVEIRRAARRELGVQDIRTATPQQLAQMRRAGLIP